MTDTYFVLRISYKGSTLLFGVYATEKIATDHAEKHARNHKREPLQWTTKPNHRWAGGPSGRLNIYSKSPSYSYTVTGHAIINQ